MFYGFQLSRSPATACKCTRRAPPKIPVKHPSHKSRPFRKLPSFQRKLRYEQKQVKRVKVESETAPPPLYVDQLQLEGGVPMAEEDLAWRGVRWHRHLDEAAEEARQLGRPILLWAMNGHPCGET